MSVTPEAIQVVEDWLREEFPAANVASGVIFDRDAVLFRARTDQHSYELQVTEEAFRSYAPDAIVADLDGQHVADRLRRDPSLRLTYDSSRVISHFETLLVTCDGKTYRVVRDAHHDVQIFDGNNRPLANSPKGVRNLPSSVFRKPIERWREEIRDQRGQGQ